MPGTSKWSERSETLWSVLESQSWEVHRFIGSSVRIKVWYSEAVYLSLRSRPPEWYPHDTMISEMSPLMTYPAALLRVSRWNFLASSILTLWVYESIICHYVSLNVRLALPTMGVIHDETSYTWRKWRNWLLRVGRTTWVRGPQQRVL